MATREERLSNGLRIDFVDETNRYFGDYHRVCLRVIVRCEIAEAAAVRPEDAAFWTEAGDVLGDCFQVEKTLVRMGVCGDEVEDTVQSLGDAYMKTANAYMTHPDYPKRLARAEMDKQKKKVRFL